MFKLNDCFYRRIVCGLPIAFFSLVAQASSEAGPAQWHSILPPVVAIAVALLLRSVVPALFVGIWLASWAMEGWTFSGIGVGLLHSFVQHIRLALADPDHASVILFSLMIGGMVGIISRNGGAIGIVNALSGWANSRRRGQLATAFMGLVVFVDDYANTLVVGNTMRPVTDRLRISREKLAYLVDSTAAPVSAIAVVTTWIGYQVGLLDQALKMQGLESVSGYSVFLHSIAYSFYPILAVVLVFWIASSGRDFGPMAVAEQRAIDCKEELEVESAQDRPKARAINAGLPLLVLIGTVLASLYISGEGATVREIVGSADAYQALLHGSLLGVLCALALPMLQRAISLEALMDAWVDGVRSMSLAMVILVLAWALSGACEQLGTADFLVSSLSDRFPASLLPATVFLIATATAFATGTSWGAMGILIPLVVPLSVQLGADPTVPGPLLYGSVAAILAGAVCGDHCSPISDTTILSSMASGCDHVEHVRTQMPYALLVGLISLLIGFLPAGFGVPAPLLMAAGTVVLIGSAVVLSNRSARQRSSLNPVIEAASS